MKALRDYQIEGIELLRASLRRGNKRLVFHSPTGSGKSVVAVEIIKMARAKNKRVMFLVNRAGLVHQFSRHLTSNGISHGILQSSNTHSLDAQVIVGTIQTAARRGMPLDTSLVIIDEAHGAAGSNEYKKLIFQYSNITWIGLTATSMSRGMAKVYDELQGQPLFQDLIVPTTISKLIKAGHLVDCEIFAPSEPDVESLKLNRNPFGEWDYSEKDLALVVDKKELIGDIVKNWLLLAKGKKTVCFATNVAHSKHIVAQFQAAGIKAEHIDGYMDDEEKAPITKRFDDDEITILSNVAMLKEGWDVPSCEAMILAKPTRSLIAWIQMCGRVLRPFAGKLISTIIDHSGTVHRLGYPTDDLELKLCDGTKKEDEKDNKKDKKDKKEKKCPKCNYIKKTHKCDNCGFEPEKLNTVEVEDGELIAITKGKKLDTSDKRKIFAELKYIANERGWSDGALAWKFRGIVGTWPNAYKNEPPVNPSIEVLNMVKHLTIKYVKSRGNYGNR